MSVNQRIKELRKALNLSQAKFADNISISNGYIAWIELEKRRVNDRIIKLICSVYDVSESWLKTGEGLMFERTQNDRFDKAMSLFCELQPEFQDYVLRQIDDLLAMQGKRQEHPGG